MPKWKMTPISRSCHWTWAGLGLMSTKFCAGQRERDTKQASAATQIRIDRQIVVQRVFAGEGSLSPSFESCQTSYSVYSCTALTNEVRGVEEGEANDGYRLFCGIDLRQLALLPSGWELLSPTIGNGWHRVAVFARSGSCSARMQYFGQSRRLLHLPFALREPNRQSLQTSDLALPGRRCRIWGDFEKVSRKAGRSRNAKAGPGGRHRRSDRERSIAKSSAGESARQSLQVQMHEAKCGAGRCFGFQRGRAGWRSHGSDGRRPRRFELDGDNVEPTVHVVYIGERSPETRNVRRSQPFLARCESRWCARRAARPTCRLRRQE